MFTYAALSAWITSLGVDTGLLNQGPFIPEMPNTLITLTLLSGVGFLNEGDIDSPSFQVRVRGEQNDQASAEALAGDIDGRLFRAVLPTVVNGTPILLVDRVGGLPSILGPADDGERYEYVCTYRLMVGRQ